MLLPSSCPVTIWLHLAIKTSQLQMGPVVICKEIGQLRMAVNGHSAVSGSSADCDSLPSRCYCTLPQGRSGVSDLGLQGVKGAKIFLGASEAFFFSPLFHLALTLFLPSCLDRKN